MRNPERDRDLNSARGGSLPLGLLWSCGPQLASHCVSQRLVAKGNLTKASTSEFPCLENFMPQSLHPFKYLKRCSLLLHDEVLHDGCVGPECL